MSRPTLPQAPFLVFPDQDGGFFVFHSPRAVFDGPQLAEALGWPGGGWVAGGLEYAPAEGPAPGWWGVFGPPEVVTWADLEAWADPTPVLVGALEGIGFEDYRRAFDRVKAALAEGRTYQVNLTFGTRGRVVGEVSVASALRLWIDLVRAQGREAVFAALGTADHPAPLVVSASPELFFHQEGSVVEARPMKGTALRHPEPGADAAARHDLATNPKTRAENLMVTDMLRNDLGRLARPGGVAVPRLFEVEAYPTVWQMTSTVRAELAPSVTLPALLDALFPCASITGAPKVSTQTVIEAAESGPRGWYTGTLGWHRPASSRDGVARSRFSVLIRTLVLPDLSGSFQLGVGGGVVWDSTAEGEYAEAWAKTRFLGAVQRTFALTEAVLWEQDSGLFLWDEHVQRLSAACRAFGGAVDRLGLERSLGDVVARLRPQGGAPLKLRVLVDPDFSVRVEGEDLSPLPDVVTVALAPRAFGPETLPWRRFKTSHRRVYDENRAPGVDQTLHYNERGELTESTSMNVVLRLGGRLVTPALSSGLLGGTFRAHLLATGAVEEAVLPVSALDEAEEVWLVNSVRRWTRARLRPIIGATAKT